jgi:hypothetical protein
LSPSIVSAGGDGRKTLKKTLPAPEAPPILWVEAFGGELVSTGAIPTREKRAEVLGTS